MAISGILTSQNHYNQRASGFWPTSVYVFVVAATQKAIFGYGISNAGIRYSMTNLVSNTGVVSTDTAGVGTVRSSLAAAGYGGDKAIFGYGNSGSRTSLTNLV